MIGDAIHLDSRARLVPVRSRREALRSGSVLRRGQVWRQGRNYKAKHERDRCTPQARQAGFFSIFVVAPISRITHLFRKPTHDAGEVETTPPNCPLIQGNYQG